jgi:tetratricopeptide (TPR) repeat protein
MLAYHFWKGEDWPRAYKYNREAGLKAQSFSAYKEAFNFIKAALDALKKLPRTRKHLEQDIDLRFNMRSALFPLGRHDDWAEHVREAELLAREISDNARLAACYNYLTAYHFIQGRHKEAIRVGEEGLRLAESAGDFSITVTTKFHLAIPLFNTGRIERSVKLNREVVEQLSGPAALERHGLSSVPAVVTRGFLAWGLSELGEFEEAETWSRQGIELTKQVKNVFSTALVYASSGFAFLRHGKLDTALKLLQKADRLGREADMQSISSYIAGSLGDVYLLLDRPDDAIPILEKAVEPQSLDSSVISTIHPISVLAEAYRLTGQIKKAVKTAEEALRVFRQTEEICFGAWAIYVMAKIQSETGSEQIGQATHTYRRAISLAEELKMRPLLAHCHLDLGKFYNGRGEIKKARSELMKAIDLYRSLDMRFWLPKTEALLSEVS